MQEKAKVDVLVAVQPVISDGRLAPVLAQQWGKCIVFWATPEEQTGEMISGNSLVKKKRFRIILLRTFQKQFAISGWNTFDVGNVTSTGIPH